MANQRAFEVLEDDLLPNPIIQKKIQDGKLPEHLDIWNKQGKLWFGHAYRMARELMYDPDQGIRIMMVSQSLLAVAVMLPDEFIKECISLAIEEIKNGKPGLPHLDIDDPEKLAKWRAKILKAEGESE